MVRQQDYHPWARSDGMGPVILTILAMLHKRNEPMTPGAGFEPIKQQLAARVKRVSRDHVQTSAAHWVIEHPPHHGTQTSCR